MIYSYHCLDCSHVFDRDLEVEQRNDPLKEPCPKCSAVSVKRNFIAPAIVSSAGSTISMTDGGWNDTLKRIKKASGKSNTIETK